MFWFFNKKEKVPHIFDNTDVNIDPKSNIMDLNDQIKWLQQNQWCSDYDVTKKNILIMDDRIEIISSIIDDLTSLNESNSFFIDEYNILSVSSKMAGFHVIDILNYAPDIEINYALLDIILGGKKMVNDKKYMVDGVDVALEIWDHFPAADILFFSGCIIENNIDPLNFKNKFDNYTGEDMNDFIIPKDASFDQELHRLLNFFNGLSNKSI